MRFFLTVFSLQPIHLSSYTNYMTTWKEVKIERLFQGGLPDIIQASYENNELYCDMNTFKRRV